MVLLRFKFSDHYHEYIIFPKGDCFNDTERLRTFVDNAALDLTSIKENERQSAFAWVIKHSGSTLKSLDISDPEIEREKSGSKKQYIQDILSVYDQEKGTLQQLKYLCLRNLGLASIPDVSNFRNLIRADFSHNQIKNPDDGPGSKSLKELDLSTNPIESLDTDLSKYPALGKVHVGSQDTKYLGHQFIICMFSKFQVFFHETCATSVVYPSYNVVSNTDSLRQFLDQKELTLTGIDNSKKSEAFTWALAKFGMVFDAFSLSNEGILLQESQVDLSTCFSTHESLQNLKEIHLDCCGLKTLPKMSSLSKLEVVDVRNNEIEKVDNECLPSSVVKLLIDGNPIQDVQIDCIRLLNLSQVQCGSRKTRYISHSLVRKFDEGVLNLVIPSEYEIHLQLPPAIVFEDKEHLSSYVRNPHQYLKYVVNEYKPEVAKWLFFVVRSTSGTLDLSHQSWLFRNDQSSQDINLTDVAILKLNYCDLQMIPIPNKITQIKHLQLQGNQLQNLSVEEKRGLWKNWTFLKIQ